METRKKTECKIKPEKRNKLQHQHRYSNLRSLSYPFKSPHARNGTSSGS